MLKLELLRYTNRNNRRIYNVITFIFIILKLKQPQLLPPQLVVNQQFQMAYLSYVKELLMYLSPKAGFVADLEIAAMNELGNQLSMVVY